MLDPWRALSGKGLTSFQKMLAAYLSFNRFRPARKPYYKISMKRMQEDLEETIDHGNITAALECLERHSILSYEASRETVWIKWDMEARADKMKQREDPPTMEKLMERYNQEQTKLIVDVINALATTRKSGKLSEAAAMNIVRTWSHLAPERVEYGISIYLEKGYHLESKREQYLLAIMNNATPKAIKTGLSRKNPNYSKATQDNLDTLEQIRAERKANASGMDRAGIPAG